MTSVTSPQQTDRRGTDEIPGPRGGQGVRLLVLGADPDAQELRDQATAAGYELAQRYSARVSHVAYGNGIDPGDARYMKIRDAGLVLLPLQKCAEELGLGTDETDEIEAETETEPAQELETEVFEPDVAEVDVAEVETAEGAAINAPLEIPPLHLEPEQPEQIEQAEQVDEVLDEDVEDDFPATDFVPGFSEDETTPTDVPLAAAVIGIDPWTGPADEGTDEVADEVEATPDPTPTPTPTRHTAGHVLLSVLWALIPFATFGLLTPVAFGYAAYRLRSRALVLTAIGYTVAVVASFVLSAIRPHSATPSDAAGALLTLCLAGTSLGGTLHALGIRTRVFAR